MKYIFIDTNNWKFCSLLMRDDHTPKTLRDLEQILSEDNNIKLLMPEVTKLEYYRVVDNAFVEDIKKEIQRVKESVQKSLPEHLESKKNKFYEVADNLAQERRETKDNAIKVFENIIGLNTTIEIPLEADIIIESEKRRIKKLTPSNGNHSTDQDCYIIESLKSYVKSDINKENSTLIFCTEDGDFLNREGNDLEKDIKNDFEINIKYYKYLHDMLKEEFEININDKEAENIEKMKNEKQLKTENTIKYNLIEKEHKFTEKEKEIYLNFADALVSHINIMYDDIQLVKNPKQIIKSLGEVIDKSQIEKHLQDNTLLISCFVNNKYEYSPRKDIKVSTIKEFYKFLKNISPVKREIVIKNLHLRLNNITVEPDVPF